MSMRIAQLEVSAASDAEATASDKVVRPERPLGIARGIVNAVLIATPFWVLFAFAVYLLI
jgi:hypothetical protein